MRSVDTNAMSKDIHMTISILNVKCKNVECLEVEPNININLNGYKIEETLVNVRGVCPNCS